VLGAGRYTVSGELTIRGVTQPIRLVVELVGRAPDVQGNPRLGLQATAKLQRALWGITWNAPIRGGGVALAEDVDLELDGWLLPVRVDANP
jgi:polyisoprenoid-binding protein YceI